MGFSLVAESEGSSPVEVCGLLVAVASLVAERGLYAGLSSCGAGALSLHGMWGLTGSGVEPVSPALAGRFFTTEPPGKRSWLLLTLSVVRPAPIGERVTGFMISPKTPSDILVHQIYRYNDINHLYRAVLQGLCLPLANYLVSFFILELP